MVSDHIVPCKPVLVRIEVRIFDLPMQQLRVSKSRTSRPRGPYSVRARSYARLSFPECKETNREVYISVSPADTPLNSSLPIIPCLRSYVILNFAHEHKRTTSRKNLPLPERLDLLDALWESVIAEGYEPPLTSAQADELDRRLQAH